MRLLSPLFAPAPRRAATPGPADDFWYNPIGYAPGGWRGQEALSGIKVTPVTALRASSVLACVRVLSENIAALPCVVMRQEGARRERAPEHPLYGLLHDQPNGWQTAYEFWRLAVVSQCLWGNFYAEIVPGVRGFTDQLVPLHPERVTPLQRDDYRLLFRVRALRGGGVRYLAQEEVFRLHGLSLNGAIGEDAMDLAREVIGLILAQEGYAARLFANDATPGGVLEHPGRLDVQTSQRIQKSWNTAHAGVERAHSIAVLEEGMKYAPTQQKAQEAQLVESRRQQAVEVARMFRVPPYMIGLTETANYKVEQQGIEFVTQTLVPWVRQIEQAITRDLILEPQRARFFPRFVVDGLLRGDSASRAAFYASAIQNGWRTRNEVRELEDLNPGPAVLDEFLSPLNMRQGANAPQPSRGDQDGAGTDAADGDKEKDAEDDDRRRGVQADPGRRLALAAATRLVRKVIRRLSDEARRAGDDAARWRAAAGEFLAGFAGEIEQALALPSGAARPWCEARLATALAAGGLAALAASQEADARALAALALNIPTGEENDERIVA